MRETIIPPSDTKIPYSESAAIEFALNDSFDVTDIIVCGHC